MGSILYTESLHQSPDVLGFQSKPGDPALTIEEQMRLNEEARARLEKAKYDADDYNRRKMQECSLENFGACVSEASGVLLLGGIVTIYVLKNL